MQKERNTGLRRLFGWVLTLSILVAGGCLLAGCVWLYATAGGYSRETVAATFARVAVPVYLCVALLLVSCVWEMIAPTKGAAQKPPRAYDLILRRVCAGREITPDIARLQKGRRTRAAVRLGLAVAGMAVFLLYALQGRHFTGDINGSVVSAMWVALPCFLLPAGFSVYVTLADTRSLEKEIALWNALPAGEAKPAAGAAPDPTWVRWVRLAVIAVAVAALVYGWLAGGTADVLGKAAKICTECIGLG